MSAPRAPADLTGLLESQDCPLKFRNIEQAEREAFYAFLAARGVRVVPEGAVACPREPSEAMIQAVVRSWEGRRIVPRQSLRPLIEVGLRAALRQAGEP